MDDVITVVKKGQTQSLQDHMNMVHVSVNIKFKREEKADNNLPFYFF